MFTVLFLSFLFFNVCVCYLWASAWNKRLMMMMLWWGLFDFIALSLSAVRYERHQPTCKISCFSTQQAQRFRPVMKTERERNAKLWLWLCGCRAVRVVFFQNVSNLTVYFRLSLFIVIYNFRGRRTTVGIRAMPYKANFIASNFRNWRLGDRFDE